uniref:Uncharacterized protein n=1 Tax=Trichogramma kaykai TaxID=54128 RepID=A0ABD2WMD7_9HYME
MRSSISQNSIKNKINLDFPSPLVNVKSRQVGERASRAAFIEFLQSRTSYLFRYRRKKTFDHVRTASTSAHSRVRAQIAAAKEREPGPHR